jgi:glycosyltransferase involved in cell wall biosynthesis
VQRGAVIGETAQPLAHRQEVASKFRATAAICTRNGAKRIPRVLEALARQDCPPAEWEVLVVDSSTDRSKAIAAMECARLFGARGRVVSESRPGLSFAREQAASVAWGDIICFVDDDNLLAPDFVSAAVAAFQARPRAGAMGGKVLPLWEAPPTPLAVEVACFALAISDWGDTPFIHSGISAGPVGAGICVRRNLLREIYADPRFARRVLGGTAGNVPAGDDTALAVAVRQRGWECWYEPCLKLWHQLPSERMSVDYLRRYYYRIGLGQACVRGLFDWKARTPLAWLIGFKDLGRWAIGHLQGPPNLMRSKYPLLANDLHALHQSMVLARAKRAMRWPL